MIEAFGNILTPLIIGVVFPAMMLPMATLAVYKLKGSRDAQDSAGAAAFLSIWTGLCGLVAGAAALFAALAVDLAPFAPSKADAGVALAGFAALAVFIALRRGANALHLLVRGAEPVVRAGGRVALVAVLAMALVQFTVVILRYVFGVNFIFVQESVTYFHGTAFLAAAGYALLTNDHVRVDIFYGEASEARKALVDLAGTYAFLFPFCLVALWTASPYVGAAWSVFEGSAEQSGIQGVFLLKTLIPVFALLLAMAGLGIATRAVTTLAGATEAARPA